MKSKKASLFKNILLFALNSFSSKMIAFLLVPLYTYKLSTHDYGVADLLFTISGFLIPFLTFNIVESVFRFSVDKDADKEMVVGAGIKCNIVCAILGLFAIPILGMFEDYKDYSVLFYFYMVSVSLSQTMLAFLRGQEKILLFSIGNIINIVFAGIFNIIFLLILDMGVYGFFLAFILSNIVTTLYAILFGGVRVSFKRRKNSLLKEMIVYSTVLIPTNFAWWIMNSSDKVMIANFIDPSANGIYAISYKIPMVLTVAISVFNQAWFFTAVKEDDKKSKEKQSNMAFNYLMKLSILINILILFILKPFTSLYVSADYYSSWQYVPILLFGYVFNTLATFLATTYYVEKNNKGILFSGMFGALSNIIMNFILIPLIGVFGAAIATSLSYVAVFIYRFMDTKKTLHVIAFKKEYIVLYILLILANCVIYLNTYLSYVILSVLLAVFIVLIRKDLLYFIKIGKGFLLRWKKN